MQRYHFEADGIADDARWNSWRHSLSEFAVDAYGDGDGESGFDGQIATCVTATGLSFTLVESHAPQRWASTPGKIGDTFWLSISLSGESILHLGETSIPMAPGDILYGKRGVPSALDISTGFRQLLINIPGSTLARKAPFPLPNKAIYLSGQSGIGRIFSGLLTAIADCFDDLDDATVGPVEAALPQFLLSSLFPKESDLPIVGAAAVRAGALQRIWQSIENSLGDADLSISRIAEEHQLSVRYVQKLFEDSGQSFSTYVRRRRLEQCRADLANKLNADVSITATCFRWGFNDSATFSRAFRDEFGVSPRQYRKAEGARIDPPEGRKRFRNLAPNLC